ncbi:MAG: hypothetical protein GF317_19770 [Candidatus Lokiarchaeota archaeon]|nr:hypothetical protein [Candidatus Lokiarchaeota archaeon]MBD3201733.1 hypothetical protein [Candidatus Lokiarchaeota archaeon]
MEKKKKFISLLFLSNLLVVFIFMFLFIFYLPFLTSALVKYDTAWILILIILYRILSFILFCGFLYYKWFKQEVIYTSDGFFLFALFYNLFIYGKWFDLFSYLAFGTESINESFFLIILKIRYLIIILEAIPLLYLGLEILVNYLKTRLELIKENQSKKIRQLIILIFLSIMTVLILIAPTSTFIINLFPILVFGTILGIVIMFLFMYRMKLLSQANGLIIGIGFILFMISSIIRSILSTQFNPIPVIISEIIDSFVFLVIFIGFIKKPKYKK